MSRYLAVLVAAIILATAASASAATPIDQSATPFSEPGIRMGFDGAGRLIVEETVVYSKAQRGRITLSLAIHPQTVSFATNGTPLLPKPKSMSYAVKQSKWGYVQMVMRIPAATVAQMISSKQSYQVAASYDSGLPLKPGFTQSTYVSLDFKAKRYLPHTP